MFILPRMNNGRPAALLALVLTCALLPLGGCLPSASSQVDEEKEYHFLAGKSRVHAMDYKAAIESFEKALEANPHSGAAHLELGVLFDQKEADPAAAIYHYNKYLALRSNADNSDMVKARIHSCKQELARTVTLGPVAQSLQREFEQLTDENKRLREEIEKYKLLVQQLQAASAARPQAASGASPLTPQTGPAVAVVTVPGRTGAPPASAARTHVVKSGETLTTISRRYGVRVDQLTAANPGLNPRRMRIGQEIRIP